MTARRTGAQASCTVVAIADRRPREKANSPSPTPAAPRLAGAIAAAEAYSAAASKVAEAIAAANKRMRDMFELRESLDEVTAERDELRATVAGLKDELLLEGRRADAAEQLLAGGAR